MAGAGVAGDHDVFGDVLLIGPPGRLHTLAQLHDALGVGDAGAELQKDGGVVFLGQLEGPLGKVPGLGGVRRFQHGDLGGDGVVPGVLFVLGGVHPRVICYADDHAGVDAGVGDGEQRVGGHVQAHVLHHAGAALAGQGRAEGDLHGDLLVGRPLAVDLVILSGPLGDLRAGGAGIAGNERTAGLIEASGCGLVAQHQFLHG